MHSGADVDAFQAALNRDIEGSMNTSLPLVTNPGLAFIPLLAFSISQLPFFVLSSSFYKFVVN